MRTFLWLPVFLLVRGQETADWEGALWRFGDRQYRILDGGKPVATVKLKSSMVMEDGSKVAFLYYEYAIGTGDLKRTMQRTEKVKMDGFRLISGTLKRSGEKTESSVSVDGSKAILNVRGREQSIKVPEGTVGELAVLRLVCAGEQKEGVEFKVNVLSMDSECLERDHTFKCLGKEEIEVAGKKLSAVKWEEKGEWKHTTKVGDKEVPSTLRIDNTYWISTEGYLIRFRSDRIEMVLEAK